MLDMDEINRAIAELEAGKTTSTSCAKLADLYAIRDHAEGQAAPRMWAYPEYSLAAAPDSVQPSRAGRYGDSEFLSAVAGKDLTAAWKVVDGVMETLRVVNPRVYDSVLRKMRQI